MGRPILLAIQPARMSPKLPVGTAKETARYGAPSATAAGKIIDRLRHHPRPIDRIHAGEREFVAQPLIREKRLHQRLGIIEGPVERDDMDILGRKCGHLPALHVRDAALRVKDEQIDLGDVAESCDSGGAGIARGRSHDRRAFAARGEDLSHQPAQELHGKIFESQRRPVKKFEKKEIVADLQRAASPPDGQSRHRLPRLRREAPCARARRRRKAL